MVAWAAVLAWAWRRHRGTGERWRAGLLAGTLVAGLGNAYVVKERYGGQDAYNYYLQGLQLRRLAVHEPGALRQAWRQPRAFAAERDELSILTREIDGDDLSNWVTLAIVGVAATVALDGYYATAACFAGTIALLLLPWLTTVARGRRPRDYLPLYGLLALPTVGFFCYGLGKEAILLLCAVIVLRTVTAARPHLGHYVAGAAALALAIVVRYEFVVPCLAVALVTRGLDALARRRGLATVVARGCAVGVGLCALGAAAMAADAYVLDYVVLRTLTGGQLEHDLLVADSPLRRVPLARDTYRASDPAFAAATAGALLPTALLQAWRGIDYVATAVNAAELALLGLCLRRYGSPTVVSVAVGSFLALVLLCVVISNAGTVLRHRSLAIAVIGVTVLAYERRRARPLTSRACPPSPPPSTKTPTSSRGRASSSSSSRSA